MRDEETLHEKSMSMEGTPWPRVWRVRRNGEETPGLPGFKIRCLNRDDVMLNNQRLASWSSLIHPRQIQCLGTWYMYLL